MNCTYCEKPILVYEKARLLVCSQGHQTFLHDNCFMKIYHCEDPDERVQNCCITGCNEKISSNITVEQFLRMDGNTNQKSSKPNEGSKSNSRGAVNTQIDSDYLCPICGIRAANRKIIPCGHCFCFDCIIAWRKQTVKKNQAGTRCALCRGLLKGIEVADIPKEVQKKDVEGGNSIFFKKYIPTKAATTPTSPSCSPLSEETQRSPPAAQQKPKPSKSNRKPRRKTRPLSPKDSSSPKVVGGSDFYSPDEPAVNSSSSSSLSPLSNSFYEEKAHFNRQEEPVMIPPVHSKSDHSLPPGFLSLPVPTFSPEMKNHDRPSSEPVLPSPESFPNESSSRVVVSVGKRPVMTVEERTQYLHLFLARTGLSGY